MTIPRKIRINVQMEARSPGDEVFVNYIVVVTNISLTGCFIRTDQRLRVGAPVSFDLPLTTGEKIELDGRIVREQAEPRGYGVKFVPLLKHDRKALALLIAATEEI